MYKPLIAAHYFNVTIISALLVLFFRRVATLIGTCVMFCSWWRSLSTARYEQYPIRHICHAEFSIQKTVSITPVEDVMKFQVPFRPVTYYLNRLHRHYRHHQPLRIRPYVMFLFRITSEIMNQFNTWCNSLDGGSARRKASTSTGQHNTEGREQTSVP
jgi:hypothetical protein